MNNGKSDIMFEGLGIALVTPFKDNGEIDFETLTQLIDFQLGAGVDFLCILGTTAETPCLTRQEKQLVKEHVVKVVNGRAKQLPKCHIKNYGLPSNHIHTAELRHYFMNSSMRFPMQMNLFC